MLDEGRASNIGNWTSDSAAEAAAGREREAERKLVSGKRTDTKRSVEQNRMLSRVSKLSI